MPVDLYVGGAEHAVLHLLYARFWHKVLYDAGVVSTPEPFQKLVNQGMILGEMEFTVNGERVGRGARREARRGVRAARPTRRQRRSARYKMSKSRGNVVNPDEIVARLRRRRVPAVRDVHGPARAAKPWNTRGVEGMHRFLNRVWRLVVGADAEDGRNAPAIADAAPTPSSSAPCTARSRRSPKTSRRCASTRRSRR